MRCRYASRLSVVNTPLPSALSIKIYADILLVILQISWGVSGAER